MSYSRLTTPWMRLSSAALQFSAIGVASSVMNLLLFIIVGVCTGVSIIFGHALSLILGQTDGSAFGNTAAYLRIISLFYTFCFTGNAFAGYLKGRGYVYVSFMGTAGHISLRVVFTWIFIKEYQLPSVALASGTGWVLVNLFWTFFLWRKAKKDRELKNLTKHFMPHR